MTALSRLKQLAESATPGPYSIERRDDEDGDIAYVIHGGPKGCDVAWCNDDLDKNARQHAAFIAAVNPQTILALSALVEAADRMRLDAILTIEEERDYDAARQALEEALR